MLFLSLQVSSFPAAPPILLQLTKNVELLKKYDLSSLMVVMSGAAPLPESVNVDTMVKTQSMVTQGTINTYFYTVLISRHAYEVSEAGFVFDLFLLIILILQQNNSCSACISRTAWSWTLIFLHKVDTGVQMCLLGVSSILG